MSMIIPDTVPPDKLKDLMTRGTVVEPDALQHLADQGFVAAIEALDAVKKNEHENLKALVIMDPDEEALIVLWQQD